MSKRVPVDIQFLMESILSESPDRFSITDEDVTKFKKLGMNITAGRSYWDSPDAYPFFIEPKDRIVIYRHGETHGNIEVSLLYAPRKTGSEASFSFAYDFSSMNGDIGFKSKGSQRNNCYFHGLKGNDLNDVREYIAKHAEYFEHLEIRGPGGESKVEAHEIAGRVWVDKRVISFWNEKEKVMPFMKEIFSFMENLNMNVEKCLYEFIDSRGFYTHYELTGQLPDTKEKLSAAEKQELLAQKHLEKDKEEFGSQFWAQHGKKAAKGFDIPAKASAAMPAREGIIKLKDLIKESPDNVVAVSGGSRIAHYSSGDAVAFFAYPKFSVLNRGGVHTDIMQELQLIYDNIDQIKNDPDEKQYYANQFRNRGFEASNFDEVINDISSGVVGKYISGGNWRSDDDPGGFRTKSGGLSGRLWKDKKLISFWNDKDTVLKDWNYVEKMFNDFASILGRLEDYKVDWLERDVRGGGELTPASSISSFRTPKPDASGQMNFLDKLSGEDPISKEEILKIQQRLHTLKPAEKKEALKKLGAMNTKASDIAAKLGMTVAEFNHIMNVNESSSAD